MSRTVIYYNHAILLWLWIHIVIGGEGCAISIANVWLPNGIALLLLLTLVFSTRRTLRLRLLDDRLFFLMVACCALQCLFEPLTYAVDGDPGARLAALLMNAFLYINTSVFSFLWTVYADYKIFADTARLRRIYPFVAIPALLVTAGSLVNLFTPVFFTVSAANIYARTGLFFLPYLCTYGYLAYGVVLIYRYRSQAGRYLFLPALLFMVPIFIGSALQFLFYGLSLVWVGVAIALVSLYINVQNEVSYTDDLSGLYTRYYMHQYLGVNRPAPAGRQLGGIMLDIDHFKTINDTFGHLTGDEAIRTAGQLLRAALGRDAIAVRYAGDEFILLLYVKEEAELQQTVARIDALAEQFCAANPAGYQLRFSCGYSLFRPGQDTIDTFLRRIDEAMYADKKGKLPTAH